MIDLNHALMDTPNNRNETTKEFSSCWNSLGLYHSTQYVLRLSYQVHNLVESAANKKNGGVTHEELQAYSTYIHETVHWWQHIGSTIGFIMSMCYPAEAHSNLEHLQQLAKSKNAKKPLRSWAESEMRNGKDHRDKDVAAANAAVNNSLDIAFYRTLMMGVRIENTVATQYFESTGHSFRIAYDTAINTLRAVFDPEAVFLPNPDDWNDGLKDLEEKEVTGYYYGSPIPRYPIKGLDIIEGQARFIQLQFLYFATGERIQFDQFEKENYLLDEYGDAFRFFLENTSSKTPKTMGDPIVSLFLLVCDISLNPVSGFPKPVTNIESFIYHLDCSYRFMSLCNAVKANPYLKSHIKECSSKEYLEVSQLLVAHCGFEHPYDLPQLVKKWKDEQKIISELLEGHENSHYSEGNSVVKILFANFLSFNLDKLKCPEFFCWTGKHLARKSGGSHLDGGYEKVWLRNLSLFTDSADEQTIVPRLFPWKSEENIKKAFNDFYGENMMSFMGSQWVVQDGKFNYDFSWLTEQTDEDVIENKVKSVFEALYGINPSEIKHT